MAESRKYAERQLLAACFIMPPIVPRVRLMVEPTDFKMAPHKKLYEAILVATPAELKVWYPVGHAANWDEIAMNELVDETVTGANWEYWVGRLVEHRKKAAVSSIAQRLHCDVRSGSGASDAARSAINDLIRETSATMDAKSLRGGELFYPMLEEMDRRSDPGADRGPTFGLSVLDDRLISLQNCDLILVAARPSVGKTALAIQLAVRASGEGRRVAFASLEMGSFPIAVRAASLSAHVSGFRALNGLLAPSERDRITAATQRLTEQGFSVFIPQMRTLPEIHSEALAMRAQLVVVDYLGLIRGDASESRNQEVSAISRGLKAMAMDMKVPVVALSQLSRPDKTRAVPVPRLSDLRDSGSLEQDADVVVFLHDDPDRPKERQLIIAKHRNGPTGSGRVVWHPEEMRFEDGRFEPEP